MHVDVEAKPDVTIKLSILGIVPLMSDSTASLHSGEDSKMVVQDHVIPSKSNEAEPDLNDF